MPTINIPIDDLRVQSTFKVDNGTLGSITTGRAAMEFVFSVPGGAGVESAYVQATYSPNTAWSGVLKVNNEVTSQYGTRQTHVEIEDGETSITVPVSYRTNGSATASNGLHYDSVSISDIALVIKYASSVSPCTPPTTASIAKAVVQDASPVKLSWDGAKAGEGNTISGYTVQHTVGTDGSTWGEWTDVTTTSAKETFVDPGAEGEYKKFRIRTNGSAGTEYASDWYTVGGTLYHTTSGGDLPDATAHENMMPYLAQYCWRRIG